MLPPSVEDSPPASSNPFDSSSVPLEIWSLIADELIFEEQRDLDNGKQHEWRLMKGLPSRYMAVNRPFFELYLGSKYGEVHWTKLDEEMLKQLQELKKPMIAKHVRRLVLSTWFIDHLVKRERPGVEPVKPVKPKPVIRSWNRPPPNFLQSLTSQLISPFYTPKERRFIPTPAIPPVSNTVLTESVLDSMISSIQNMTNVVVYSLDLRGTILPGRTRDFFSVARQVLASPVRKLSLHTSITNLISLGDITRFDVLEELELHLQYDSSSAASQAEGLRRTVVSFINEHMPTLRSLAISCYTPIDLSPLFQFLGRFPRLRVFSLQAPLDEPHLSDVDSLVAFLRRHERSLQHLDIRPLTPSSGPLERAASWIRVQDGLLCSPGLLRDLKGLHLPVGSMEACKKLIQRASRTLTHLSLTDLPLGQRQLEDVLALFVRDPWILRSLQIEIRMPPADCLKLLGQKTPALTSLVLLLGEEIGADQRYRLATKPEITCMFPLTTMPAAYPFPDLIDTQIVEDVAPLADCLRHITILPVKSDHRANSSVILSEQDAALLGMAPIGTDKGKSRSVWMDNLREIVPSIEGGYRGIYWHKAAFRH